MTYIVATPSGRGRKTDARRIVRAAAISPCSEVHESSHVPPSTRKIEAMLANIITRLERIEEKIDENVYPPESAIKPEFVKRIKKAQTDIAKGNGKTYDSMDAFIRAISE
ncbi:DUF2683 family protein [uncultured Methanoregula sp.]|uniref:DUF2683 family protein n=1 Tax=uncultured Methanoregula sp. TaxID=1005933 RepID=UPI002AAB3957|nr:DUF2683 family protein [uncultured Methanoregula sp.]